MAAPHVAGIAAQTWQLHPDESSAAITDRIIDYGTRNRIHNVDDKSPNILAITPVAVPGYRYFPNRHINGSSSMSIPANGNICRHMCSLFSDCVGFEEMATFPLCTLKKKVTGIPEKFGENAYIRSTIEVFGAGTTEANGIYSRINTKDVFYRSTGGVPLESIKAAWQKDDWQIFVRTDGMTTNEWWITKALEVVYRSVGNPEAVKATLFQPPTEWYADVNAFGPTIQQYNINILPPPTTEVTQASDVITGIFTDMIPRRF